MDGRTERLAFRLWTFVIRHPRIYELFGMMLKDVLGDGSGGCIRSLPCFAARGPLAAWLSERDLAAPPSKNFRQLWRERRKAGVA
jgi:hypothetical protein